MLQPYQGPVFLRLPMLCTQMLAAAVCTCHDPLGSLPTMLLFVLRLMLLYTV